LVDILRFLKNENFPLFILTFLIPAEKFFQLLGKRDTNIIVKTITEGIHYHKE